MSAQHDLSALVGSRLCHDLIGPIGAIGNGVELMMLPGSGRSDEIALIAESVTALTARIRFYRIAFGMTHGDQMISRSEVLSILTDLHPSGRISITWSSPADLPRAEVKAAFLLLLCAEQGLRSTGRVHVLRDSTGWSMSLTSPRLDPGAGHWALLTADDTADISPAEVQFPLALQTLASIGRRPRLDSGSESLLISF